MTTNIKEKIAKIIRVLSIPPIMFLLFLFLLMKEKGNIFINDSEIITLYILIGIIPILAYPLSKKIQCFSNQKREGQRELAFLFTLVGYTLAAVYSYFNNSNIEVKIITYSYCLAVYILTIFNKFLHIKASGHACSFTSPIILSSLFLKKGYLLIGIFIGFIISWASIYLKRHTLKEIMMGILISCISIFLIYYLII